MIESCDHDDDPLDHVKEFLEDALDFNIKDEDACMMSFVLHLQEKALSFFKGLDKVTISYLVELIEVFCSYWFPIKHKKCNLYVKKVYMLKK